MRAQAAPGSAAAPAQPAAGRVEAQGGPEVALSALIDEAAQDFAGYQQLTAAGKLAEAGKKLEALERTLAKLKGASAKSK